MNNIDRLAIRCLCYGVAISIIGIFAGTMIDFRRNNEFCQDGVDIQALYSAALKYREATGGLFPKELDQIAPYFRRTVVDRGVQQFVPHTLSELKLLYRLQDSPDEQSPWIVPLKPKPKDDELHVAFRGNGLEVVDCEYFMKTVSKNN